MITIKKISYFRLYRLIDFAFRDDKDLLEKYHVVNTGLTDSINDTFDRIGQTSKEYELKYFKVMYYKKPIGFFVVGHDLLYSFGINIQYRKSEILKQWWSIVTKELNHNFITMIYTKNERTISFLKKQGMIKVETENDIVTFINT